MIRVITGIYWYYVKLCILLGVETSTLLGVFLVLLILGANTWDILQSPAECAPQVKRY